MLKELMTETAPIAQGIAQHIKLQWLYLLKKHYRKKCNINKMDVMIRVIEIVVINYLYPLVWWCRRVLVDEASVRSNELAAKKIAQQVDVDNNSAVSNRVGSEEPWVVF